MPNIAQLRSFINGANARTCASSCGFVAMEVPKRLVNAQVMLESAMSELTMFPEMLGACRPLHEELQTTSKGLKDILPNGSGGGDLQYVRNVLAVFEPLDQQIAQFFKLVRVLVSKNSRLKRRSVQSLLQSVSSAEISSKIVLEHHLYGFEKVFCHPPGASFDPVFKRYGIVTNVNLQDLVEDAVSHVKSMSITHFGAHPAIAVDSSQFGPETSRFLALESQIHYVVMELLKNSIKAMVDRYGSLNLDLESTPGVIIRLSGGQTTTGLVGVQVFDQGLGIPKHLRKLSGNDDDDDDRFALFDFFSSTVQEEPNPTYTYSRHFGPPFSGFGSGLSLSRRYANLHGGSIEISSLPGANTVTTAWFDGLGNSHF
eukprot:TRINITY_DN33142_c0_g1_i2.p1 TRINITY_DN33142_c0_g1~~TRINITY_DN33142_c0_g1_i2.p1  ORF type:complete len:371 (+),score=91.31 TRINITY_DN33142_c0_g1_i2:99-1211(+)